MLWTLRRCTYYIQFIIHARDRCCTSAPSVSTHTHTVTSARASYTLRNNSNNNNDNNNNTRDLYFRFIYHESAAAAVPLLHTSLLMCNVHIYIYIYVYAYTIVSARALASVCASVYIYILLYDSRLPYYTGLWRRRQPSEGVRPEIPYFLRALWGNGGRSPHAHHTASETSTTSLRQVDLRGSDPVAKSAGTTRRHT